MSKTIEKELLKEDLDKLINLLGEDGEHWTQGAMKRQVAENEYCFCLSGGIEEILPGYDESSRLRRVMLISTLVLHLPPSVRRQRSGRYAIVFYNDKRKWSTIKKLLQKAKESVENM